MMWQSFCHALSPLFSWLPLLFFHLETRASLNLPSVNTPLLQREVYVDAVQLPVVHCEGFGISFVFYLLQGFLGCTIQFKLYDVDVILRFSFIGM